MPSHPIVHFDTKLVSPKGRDIEDRGAVLISGGDELPEPKLLGIPRFESSKGEDVANVVLEKLKEYDVDLSTIAGVVYDYASYRWLQILDGDQYCLPSYS